AAEDLFQKHMPIHWMWWPAIGGLGIGLGGLLFPQALGVGYDTIGALLQGDVPRTTLLGVLLVKSSIWAFALGSGTSGGVLPPRLPPDARVLDRSAGDSLRPRGRAHQRGGALVVDDARPDARDCR